MNKKLSLFLAALILLISSCSDGRTKTETSVVESKESPSINPERESKEQTATESLKPLSEVREQIIRGDYKQIDELITQVNSYTSKDTVQMTAGQRLSFPQPSKEILVDFLKSINLDSLKDNKEFEKKYSFDSAPKGYKPDSNECPDGLTLSLRENASEFALSIDNRFLVDADIGCAESMTIYYLSVEREKLLLNSLDYAG
ncbi:hypothetical protein [Rufibacter tibetensis]|uniref:Lipoprotein n=1 Tax=Rufibacter tibetensis TaxID=512763 RepID=A0A0P0C6A6_9BACT|nr:hypothetical protein [Rufibacter tibetensis]ALJ00744.1 hypothetical protein DC20_19360 [Rufibacter tibetensis]